MRLEDFRDYFMLRRLTANPWEVVRFRKRGQPGDRLQVRLRDAPPLHVRGGYADFHMFHRIFLRDEYRLSSAAPQTWECVVDLGANVGLFAARAATLAERVIAYEPFPGNFVELERNLRGRKNVEAVCAAVAGESGTLRLHRPKHDALSGVYSSYAGRGGLLSEAYDEVPATTLDELFTCHAVEVCDLLKIDVEGQEYEILHAAGAATLDRIRRIHGEYHDVDPEDPRTRIDAFRAFLQGQGFAVEVVPHPRKPNHGMFFAVRGA